VISVSIIFFAVNYTDFFLGVFLSLFKNSKNQNLMKNEGERDWSITPFMAVYYIIYYHMRILNKI